MFKLTIIALCTTFALASYVHVGQPDDCPANFDIDLEVVNYYNNYWQTLNFSIHFDNWGSVDIENYKFKLYDVMPRDRMLPKNMTLVKEDGHQEKVTIYDMVTVSVAAGQKKVWSVRGLLNFRVVG